ncbi:9213_t:CDS:10 [Funneliformis geosporum]|uniref:9213_t:CDS:1 n=1 Tax=Funneliformis geosporum TaxID=1117311 RepID=A0A9W4SVV2_9GLOM|nr:9213_t:CDS:10 [Funneliformis geosporum]
MSTYLSWLPSIDVSSYFRYTGGNNNAHSSNTTKTSARTTQSENGTMFGFFGGLFDRAPKIEKYSPENLRNLSDLLYERSRSGNDESVVDVLKELTQVLVWGDQHKPTILEYFFENNIHYDILSILEETNSSNVTKQILQTMNILFENIHDLTSLYFLLSNNYVNRIICHKFDFSNDEIMAYYIYLLRTLSFKLDTNTLFFFFNERQDDFPLYSEAIKFFNSDESMIRVAVRSVTLNIFGVNNEQMQEFILDRNASPYFSNLVNFISNFSTILDDISNSPNYHNQYQRFNYYLAEHCDNFYYINDIINLDNEKMNQELTSHLMDLLLKPVYADSLVHRKLLPYKQSTRIDSVVALALLCHVLHIFRHPPLVTAMVAMLFSNSPELMDYPQSPRLDTTYANPSSLFRNRNLYREAIMGFLIPEEADSDEKAHYYDLNTLPALCLIYMSCRNHAIAPDILLATEVYSQKLLKTRRLLDPLMSEIEDLSNDTPFSLSHRVSFDTASMTSTATTASQSRPLFTDDLDGDLLNAPTNSKADQLFVDDMYKNLYESSLAPSIKVTGENNYSYQLQTKNYRAELVQNIITLLCVHYRLCRPITLQMAAEVLLELLYYNGSGECLTLEQTEMMNMTEKLLQERAKNYFLKNHEFQLEKFEKAVNESMFGGDKYVGEIIMNSKLLFPPPSPISQSISIDPEDDDIIRDIKTLHLLRQSRILLSRKSILEEPTFEEEGYIEENKYKAELVYHNGLVDESFDQARQQMYSTTTKKDNKIHQRNDTKDSTSSWVSVGEVEKRKKTVLEKLGILL